MYVKRRLQLQEGKSYLLLGARRSGKSTYLNHEFPEAEVIDLLKADEYFEYRSRPALLRERFSHARGLIIIDEVQRIPDLLSEVHWLIENSECHFILSGSSARKLRRTGVTNLAGRLKSARMLPFTYAEIESYDLEERLQFGNLPPIVLSDEPADDLRDYCGEYLREEIYAESLVRNMPAFTKFLEMAAIGNAQIVSYATIARDCGVASKTIKQYYQILEDTLLAYMLQPWTRSKKRRAILAPKFYFFDCGIPHSLLRRVLSPKTPEFGMAFEHGMILEAVAAMHYRRNIHDLRYWKTASGIEVDLLINERIGVEFKSGNVHDRDAGGLRAMNEEIELAERWVVCTEVRPRVLADGTQVVPWRDYIARLDEL